jgi:threonine dehydratase
MKDDYLERILSARVYDVAVESPLELAPALTARLNNPLLLKREDMQPVFSFKIRGAYNKMVRLGPAQLKRGVIAASAGNHAQGVALAAHKIGCAATIVMPVTTPQIKVGAVKAAGARVELHGDSYSDAHQRASQLARRERLTFIHPYDDPDVIAGQGTIGMELLRQWSGPLHAIFVAVGGGGLIGGIAAYVKRLRPEVRIIGDDPVARCRAPNHFAACRVVRRRRRRETGRPRDLSAGAKAGRRNDSGRHRFHLCRHQRRV